MPSEQAVKDRIVSLCAEDFRKKKPVKLSQLAQGYKERYGQPIDYKALGYNKLKKLVSAIPQLHVRVDGLEVYLEPKGGFPGVPAAARAPSPQATLAVPTPAPRAAVHLAVVQPVAVAQPVASVSQPKIQAPHSPAPLSSVHTPPPKPTVHPPIDPLPSAAKAMTSEPPTASVSHAASAAPRPGPRAPRGADAVKGRIETAPTSAISVHTDARHHFAELEDVEGDATKMRNGDMHREVGDEDEEENAIGHDLAPKLFNYFHDDNTTVIPNTVLRARAPLIDWGDACHGRGSRDYGLFGDVLDVYSRDGRGSNVDGGGHRVPRRIALNVTEPFCLVACGVQGAGKSHTVGTIIENCAVPAKGVVNLHRPMPTLVLHYDDAVANPCECASIALPSIRAASWLKDHGHITVEQFRAEMSRQPGAEPTLPAAAKVVVLVSPCYYKQRQKMYSTMPRTTVTPLVFAWKSMTAKQLKVLMGIQPNDSQLYVSVLLSILRRFQADDKVPMFKSFKEELLKSFDNPNQGGPLQQRLDLLEMLVDEGAGQKYPAVSLQQITEPGTVVIADLTDPLLDASAANGIFQVLLEQFRDTPARHGKLLVCDEAHKYMGGVGAKVGSLASSIVDTVRQMRHYGIRVVISTQSPTALPSEVLELTSIAVCHRFHSRAWYEHLSKLIPLPADGADTVQELAPGEAIVFAAQPGVRTGRARGDGDGSADGGDASDHAADGAVMVPSMMRVQMRKRLTADGGASRTNHPRGARNAAHF